MRFEWLKEALPASDDQRRFAQELGILVATEAIESALLRAGISRAELANRIGRSRPFVSQVLSGSRNMTVRTLSDMLWACGVQMDGVEVSEFGVGEISDVTAAGIAAEHAASSSMEGSGILESASNYSNFSAGVFYEALGGASGGMEESFGPSAESLEATGEWRAVKAA